MININIEQILNSVDMLVEADTDASAAWDNMMEFLCQGESRLDTSNALVYIHGIRAIYKPLADELEWFYYERDSKFPITCEKTNGETFECKNREDYIIFLENKYVQKKEIYKKEDS